MAVELESWWTVVLTLLRDRDELSRKLGDSESENFEKVCLVTRPNERPVRHTGLTKRTTDGTIVSSLREVKLESNSKKSGNKTHLRCKR